MSSKTSFIQYPGYINGLEYGTVWYCRDKGLYLIDCANMSGNLNNRNFPSVFTSRYIISKSIIPKLRVTGSLSGTFYFNMSYFQTDTDDDSSGDTSKFMKVAVWSNSERLSYSYMFLYQTYIDNISPNWGADIGLVLDIEYMQSSESGATRYIVRHKYMSEINYGDVVTLEETRKNNKNEIETPLKKCYLSVDFPCWGSDTLLGIYAPKGGASGTITVGTQTKKENGESKFEIGDNMEKIYIGNIGTWH